MNEKVIPMNPVSFDDIRKELNISGVVSLNDSRVRTLAGKPSGLISLSDLRGKAAYSGFTALKFRLLEIQKSTIIGIDIYNSKHQILYASSDHDGQLDIPVGSYPRYTYGIPESYREMLKNNMSYVMLKHASGANYYVQLFLIINDKDVEVSSNIYAYGGMSINIPCVHP
ncbi:MAG: hypothetical protein ACRC92_24085 [Peptostreptococcaceae bacterium]